jgi:hypothetical protein
MLLDGGPAQLQGGGDLAVRVAEGDQPQNFELAL